MHCWAPGLLATRSRQQRHGWSDTCCEELRSNEGRAAHALCTPYACLHLLDSSIKRLPPVESNRRHPQHARSISSIVLITNCLSLIQTLSSHQSRPRAKPFLKLLLLLLLPRVFPVDAARFHFFVLEAFSRPTPRIFPQLTSVIALIAPLFWVNLDTRFGRSVDSLGIFVVLVLVLYPPHDTAAAALLLPLENVVGGKKATDESLAAPSETLWPLVRPKHRFKHGASPLHISTVSAISSAIDSSYIIPDSPSTLLWQFHPYALRLGFTLARRGNLRHALEVILLLFKSPR